MSEAPERILAFRWPHGGRAWRAWRTAEMDCPVYAVPYTRAALAAEAEARAYDEGWNAAIEAATSLPITIIPYSAENKALLDALTAYRDAIRTLRKETP